VTWEMFKDKVFVFILKFDTESWSSSFYYWNASVCVSMYICQWWGARGRGIDGSNNNKLTASRYKHSKWTGKGCVEMNNKQTISSEREEKL
jgi:hypothetical protein